MKTFNAEDMLAEYLSTGAYMFDASEVLAKCDIEKLDLDDQTSIEVLLFKDAVEDFILSQYLLAQGVSLHFDFISRNCHGNVEKWHTDAGFVVAGQNATINCFFDDTSEELGGRFDICLYQEGIIGTKNDVEGMASFYPKKHSVIIFNQNRNYLHKAVPSKNQRRMVSFAGVFADINPLHRNLVAC